MGVTWPGPGALGGACYRLEGAGGRSSTGCLCSDADGCNFAQPYPLHFNRSTVVCHVAFHVPTPPFLG